MKKINKIKIRERDKERFNYLLEEKERMKGFFDCHEELNFLRDKHNFNKRSIKLQDTKVRRSEQ